MVAQLNWPTSLPKHFLRAGYRVQSSPNRVDKYEAAVPIYFVKSVTKTRSTSGTFKITYAQRELWYQIEPSLIGRRFNADFENLGSSRETVIETWALTDAGRYFLLSLNITIYDVGLTVFELFPPEGTVRFIGSSPTLILSQGNSGMANPGIIHIYAANLEQMRLSDIPAANVKLALVAAAYAPNVSATGHTTWAEVSANEIPPGTGYATGGFSLTGENVAATAANDGFRFASGGANWIASGTGIAPWRYGVIYVAGTLWGKSSPLIGYFLGDSTPQDVALTSSGNSIAISCPADGWLRAVSGAAA